MFQKKKKKWIVHDSAQWNPNKLCEEKGWWRHEIPVSMVLLTILRKTQN